ncbi:hypothetical protein LTR94_005420 [Friedmanniomyces endolithicus]|nr:hypothetical protein LTR94_005420 [Friedmanniomyces endolithicus]
MIDLSAGLSPNAPTDSTATLVRSLRRIAQAIDVRSREIARLTGLTLPQLLVLQSIRDLGEVSTSAISRDVSMSPPTVVAVLDKLEAKGMAAPWPPRPACSATASFQVSADCRRTTGRRWRRPWIGWRR